MIVLLRHRDELVCQQVVELVTDYLDGALSRSDRRRFERHLKGCPNCSRYLEQMQATIAATGTLRLQDLSPQAEEEFTVLFRRWSKADDG